jgi:ABC-type amino acid transport substrate-binding protein
MKKLLTTILLIQILVLIPISGSKSLKAAKIKLNNNTLRVGITTNYPPVVFKNSNNANAGIEIELADELSKSTDISIQFVELEWNRLIPSLLNNEIDVIMSGMSITEDRKKLIEFTEPYMRIGQMVLFRSNDRLRFRTVDGIYKPKTRIGYEENTTGAQFVITNLKDSASIGYKSAELGITALMIGNIDYFIHDGPTVWKYTLNLSNTTLSGFYTPLTEEYLAWGVRKGDVQLLEFLNSNIKKLEQDGKIDEIKYKWLPKIIKAK